MRTPVFVYLLLLVNNCSQIVNFKLDVQIKIHIRTEDDHINNFCNFVLLYPSRPNCQMETLVYHQGKVYFGSGGRVVFGIGGR
jgi:hypothetical protein